MTDIEAYQKLLILLTSSAPIDYKGVLLKVAQFHPVEVVEAIENPILSMATSDNDEGFILDSWKHNGSVIQSIKDLRSLRHDRARKMGIDPVTQEGMAKCRGGLKDCKDDVEEVLVKHKLWNRPMFRG
jgi:hypothetical protein